MKVLQFSGGLDSLACLELLKDEKHLTVATISTDGSYPDRLEYLYKVEKRYPHMDFLRRYTDRQLGRYGSPVDVVPIKFTTMGSIIQGGTPKYQPFTECCARAIWVPMYLWMQELGATEVYRGQRADDEFKAPIRDGYTENGITYRLPVEGWSRERVRKFVEERCPDLLPSYYAQEGSSRDCWDCTAYLKHNKARISNLPAAQKSCVDAVLQEWSRDVADETRW